MKEAPVSPLRLNVAIDDYWHSRALFDGRIDVAGVELNQVKMSPPQIFARFLAGEPWEVAEMSMGKLAAIRSRGEGKFFALPIFPHRIFRHAAFYVRADSKLTVEQLAGKRIGLPDWTLTAAIYARALLTHQYQLSLDQIFWIQAGVDAPRRPGTPSTLPIGVKVHEASGVTLTRLLLDGAIDAMIAPHAPVAMSEHPGLIKRLFDDFSERDHAYWQTTGLFPIMHAIVIRREIEDQWPGTANTLIQAFHRARDVALAQLGDPEESPIPLPFLNEHIEKMQQLFKGDLWPYGIEPNRLTLSAFLDFCYEQGVSDRRLSAEELFA